MQRTDLFLGRDIPGGGHVSDKDWKNFADSVITPRFPDGYTEWAAQGKWMDTQTHQTIAEDTKVVTFIGKRGKAHRAVVDTVVRAYMQRFQQQAVLQLCSKPGVQFLYNK
ncbi:DUF3574 domain-containing protein [Filimonas lacunae]|nr:DUF3574 domain-containing protein [Filimonas lacunae]BAV06112.1 hypothetical protein FLA_2127 [Filimonas lacunae]